MPTTLNERVVQHAAFVIQTVDKLKASGADPALVDSLEVELHDLLEYIPSAGFELETTWLVWDLEYPEHGNVEVMAQTKDEAIEKTKHWFIQQSHLITKDELQLDACVLTDAIKYDRLKYKAAQALKPLVKSIHSLNNVVWPEHKSPEAHLYISKFKGPDIAQLTELLNEVFDPVELEELAKKQ